jgi:hypothetical protein
MAFELENVVPWGRTLDEYSKMFRLTISDLNQQIISFGDGPASFNAEMTRQGHRVISIDPIYQFTKADIRQRIEETRETIIEQTNINQDNFIWTRIRDVQELERIRMQAMTKFLDDYEAGKKQRRYVYHELPQQTPFPDFSFDLGLSSHFLLLYDKLGLEFHLRSITEMLRLCREIRIFPIVNLNAEKSEVLEAVIQYFKPDYEVTIERVDYEFQKGGNEMLKMKRSS